MNLKFHGVGAYLREPPENKPGRNSLSFAPSNALKEHQWLAEREYGRGFAGKPPAAL
jgi:hypothetical protein